MYILLCSSAALLLLLYELLSDQNPTEAVFFIPWDIMYSIFIIGNDLRRQTYCVNLRRLVESRDSDGPCLMSAEGTRNAFRSSATARVSGGQ